MSIKYTKGIEREIPTWLIALGILLAVLILIWVISKTINGVSIF